MDLLAVYGAANKAISWEEDEFVDFRRAYYPDGLTSKDDTLPKRILEPAKDGGRAGKAHAAFGL